MKYEDQYIPAQNEFNESEDPATKKLIESLKNDLERDDLDEKDFSTNSLYLYFRDIREYKRLTDEEVKEYAQDIQNGIWAEERLKYDDDLSDDETEMLTEMVELGNAKRERFILGNLKLVVLCANRVWVKESPLPITDLIQEGNLGLFRAVERYDPSRGIKFSTYATYFIVAEMRRALSKEMIGAVTLPRYLTDKINKMKRTEDKMSNDMGRQPTVQEMAEKLKTSEEDITNMILNGRSVLSFDHPLKGNDTDVGDLEFGDTVPDMYDEFNVIDKKELRGALMDSMKFISLRQMVVIKLLFGLENGIPMTADEVGKELNISKARVQSIQREAFQVLREERRDYLEAFLAG